MISVGRAGTNWGRFQASKGSLLLDTDAPPMPCAPWLVGECETEEHGNDTYTNKLQHKKDIP